jgi:RNA polymerase sigma factor (sigma-70 family)
MTEKKPGGHRIPPKFPVPLEYDRLRLLKTECAVLLSELKELAENFSCLRQAGEADFILRLGGARIVALEDRLRASLAELAARSEALEAAIAKLPDRERLVLRLRYVEGLTWPEIAKRTNYSERAVLYIHCFALKALDGAGTTGPAGADSVKA